MDPPAQTEETLKDALHQSVASATTFDQVREEPVFGNQSGTAILQEIRESREWRLRKDAEVAMLKDQKAQQKDLNAKHDRAITMLTSRVTDLQRTSEGYLDIRDRFLDITRCDILQLPPPNQRSTAAVRRANEAAHGPDAVGDAYVYHLRSRADGRTYLKIYGMAFRDVLKLLDDGAVGMIEAVNARAGLLCEVRTPSLLAAVDKALDRLVAAYEDHPNNSIEDQSTPLGHASVEFWQALRGARGARLQGLRHRSLA